RGDRDDRGAVRVRDDAAMRADRVRVDLGHDERHRGVHAESRRVVDDDRAALDGDRREFARRGAARGEEREVHAVEALLRQLLDGQRLAAERHRLSGRARRREEPELRQRELALLETTDDLDADGAGRADDRDDGFTGIHRSFTPLDAWRKSAGAKTKKAPPDTDGALESRMLLPFSAHAPPPPRGRAFWRSCISCWNGTSDGTLPQLRGRVKRRPSRSAQDRPPPPDVQQALQGRRDIGQGGGREQPPCPRPVLVAQETVPLEVRQRAAEARVELGG